MDESTRDSFPFQSFSPDPELSMLRSALPYIGETARKPLALCIKFMELRKLCSDFDDEDFLSACGIEEKGPDPEAMLKAMKAAAGKDKTPMIDQALSFFHMIHMYQSFMDLMEKNPELARFLSSMGNTEREQPPSDLSGFFPLFSKPDSTSSDPSGSPSDLLRFLSEFMKKPD